jgi:pimeloyl-ACP methyl ester carboxylesterase
MKKLTAAAALLPLAVVAPAQTKGQYAEVNGLKMYYEIHGTGKPLLLLHGAFGTAESWTPFLPALTKAHKVIVVEMQAHGRTADIDRPLTYAQMAEDTAAFLKKIKIEKADVFGYSMGGGIAYRLASKHPELVDKLAVLGAGTASLKEGFEPAVYEQFKTISPETFNFAELKDPYTKVAPDPSKWPVLVAKIVKSGVTETGMTKDEVKAIKAPTLIMLGDRDGTRPEHIVEVYRTLPNAQLALFPNADHFVMFTQTDRFLGTLLGFLDAPATAAK